MSLVSIVTAPSADNFHQLHFLSVYTFLSCIQDDIIFEPGEGVEEYLQLLEAGKPLPPSPREVGRPKESAQSFLRRMDKLQARYNAQFLKRKDWQVRLSQVLGCWGPWRATLFKSECVVLLQAHGQSAGSLLCPVVEAQGLAGNGSTDLVLAVSQDRGPP